MDFSLLKSYIAVAEERSFSSAAKNLFTSQQTLSKHIAGSPLLTSGERRKQADKLLRIPCPPSNAKLE